MPYAVGVDVGGTFIKSGLVLDGKILKFSKIETGKSKKEVIDNILISILAAASSKKIGRAGIGIPSFLDRNGRIISSTNIPLENLDLLGLIQSKLKIPTFIDNDARCFAFGEAIFGSGKNYENVVGVTLGTGIGGGIVINKKIYHGKGSAGELGHTLVCCDGEICNCHNKGCLEAYASATAIMREGKRAGLKIKNSLEVYNLAVKGNKTALAIFEKVGFYLGMGLTNMIHSLDPDIIIIGGQVANSWRFFEKSMFDTVRKKALFPIPKIVKSKLKNSAVLGASALAD